VGRSNSFTGTMALELGPADGAEWAAAPRSRDADPIPGVALVVDDEPQIRGLLSTLLRNRGWSVIEAADGTSALALAPESLDLLVTDYDMPSISGVVLAEQLRLRDKRLPVLMVSGHPEIGAKLGTLKGPRTAFVSKPFPLHEFISRVRLITA